MTRNRNVLLRIEDLGPEDDGQVKLRVHVTLYGLSAGVVDTLAEVSGCSKAQIVRELVQTAVRERTVYDEGIS